MKSNFGCILGILAFAVVFTLIATGLSKVGILPPDLESRSFSEDVGSSIIIVLIVVGLFFLLSSIGIIRNTDNGRKKQDTQPLPEPVKANHPDEDADFIAFSDPHYDEEPDELESYDEEYDDFGDPMDDPEPNPVWYVTPGEGIDSIRIDQSTLRDVSSKFGDNYKVGNSEYLMDSAVYLTGLEFFFYPRDPERIIRQIRIPTRFPAVLKVNGTLIAFSELHLEGKLRDELITYHQHGWRYSKDESKWFLRAKGAIYYSSALNSNGIDEVVVVMNERTVATAF